MFENINFDSIEMSRADEAEITNVVVTATIDKELNLESVAEQLDECKYDPQNFPGLSYTTSNGVSVTFFESGSINLTGISSDEEFEEARKELEEKLDFYFEEYTSTYETVNIVAGVDYSKAQLYLNTIALQLGLEDIEYTPEEFPGIVWRIDTEDVEGVMLVFSSGKLVLPGLDNTDDIQKLLHEFEETVNIKEDGTLEDPTTK